MQRLKVSGAVRPIYGPLGVKRLIEWKDNIKVGVTEKKFVIVWAAWLQLMTGSVAGHFERVNELWRFHKSASFLDQMRNY